MEKGVNPMKSNAEANKYFQFTYFRSDCHSELARGILLCAKTIY
ncbi:MAG: hypothetical protein K0S44_354 [Bacteroidetes bacterium]|jgi:hypothetical protein|nr:hypothetical protein [Bacteroidota bacterium]